jgi:hypothetical protein
MCETIDPGSCIWWVHGFSIKTGYDTRASYISLASRVHQNIIKPPVSHPPSTAVISHGEVDRIALPGACVVVWWSSSWNPRDLRCFATSPQVLSPHNEHQSTPCAAPWPHLCHAVGRPNRTRPCCQAAPTLCDQVMYNWGLGRASRLRAVEPGYALAFGPVAEGLL